MDLTDPGRWNAYVYSNQNPTTWSDPTGKSSGSGGAPVYVRECYTAYACNFYATHTDGFETSSGHSTGLVDETVSAAERARQVAAAQRAAKIAKERAATAAREAAQEEREQKNGWLQSAAGILGNVSLVAGLVPAWMCAVCGAVALTAGMASAGMYLAAGDGRAAAIAAGGTLAGLAIGGAGRLAVRSGTRVAASLPEFASAGSRVAGALSDGLNAGAKAYNKSVGRIGGFDSLIPADRIGTRGLFQYKTAAATQAVSYALGEG